MHVIFSKHGIQIETFQCPLDIHPFLCNEQIFAYLDQKVIINLVPVYEIVTSGSELVEIDSNI